MRSTLAKMVSARVWATAAGVGAGAVLAMLLSGSSPDLAWLSVIALGALALSWWMARRTASLVDRSLVALTTAAERLASGKSSVNIAAEGREHAQALAIALEGIDRRLQRMVSESPAIQLGSADSAIEIAKAEKARDIAERANAAKTAFFANISHELRTPMHGIVSFAKLGIERAEIAPPDKLEHYFRRIEGAANRMLDLVNDLLDLSKLEAGKLSFSFSKHSLQHLVTSAVDELASTLSDRGLVVEIACPEPHVEAEVDPGRIMQVVQNLIGNAAKFSPEGTHLEISLVRSESSIAFSIRDHGPGVPEGELKAVFDRFAQGSANEKSAGGTGLGLSICREIVQAHRGRIWAENHPEGGAVFCFRLPLAAEQPVEELERQQYAVVRAAH